MAGRWDEDIAGLDLPEVEKDGLQVHRNWSKAFEDHREKRFAAEVNAEPFPNEPLEKALNHIVNDGPRFVPIIACGYADELLDQMFKREIPDGVPGGKKDLFGAYGPLSDLARRIKLAYCFQMISPRLMIDLDALRKARNKLAHTWDIDSVRDYFATGPTTSITNIEQQMAEEFEFRKGFFDRLDPLTALRFRTIWILSTLLYESQFYARARANRLDPESALYGDNRPKGLSIISAAAMRATNSLFTLYPPTRHETPTAHLQGPSTKG